VKIAADAYMMYRPLMAKMKELERRCQGHEGGVHADDCYPELDHEVTRCAIETIVFSAMYLEACIYDFAAHQLGDSYVNKHIDKLDLPSKFVIVPRLVTGREINKGGLAFSALTMLVSARNALVHTKSSRVIIEDADVFEKQKEASETKHRKLHDDAHTAMKAMILMAFEMARLADPHYCFITDLSIEPNTFTMKEPEQVHALAVQYRREYEKSICKEKN
jgi:hypothetical protein